MRVLERFEGINWHDARRPLLSRTEFVSEVSTLAGVLDDARAAALRLHRAWGKLTPESASDDSGPAVGSDRRWRALQEAHEEGFAGQLLARVQSTRRAMGAAGH